MWQLTLVMLIGTTVPQAEAKVGVNTCVQCHQEQEGDLQKPVTLSAVDIHFKNGLSCDSCHGGDPTVGMDGGGPEASMSKKKGFVGAPARKAIAPLCASCHGKLEFMRRYNPQARVDQYTEYLTSVHGQRMQAGDTKTATCSDCHGAHGIRAVSDPNSSVYATNVGIQHPCRPGGTLYKERARRSPDEESGPVCSDLQRLPRQSRCPTAGSGFRCKRLRPVPRHAVGSLQPEPSQAGLRGEQTACVHHLS
jgi:hypothetical protein